VRHKLSSPLSAGFRKPVRTRFAQFGLLAAGWLSGDAAWAHGAFGTGKSLWDGPVHLFTSPLSIAALIALACVLAGIGERLSVISAAVAGATASITSALPLATSAYWAPAAVVIVGLGAVVGKRPPALACMLLAALAGFTAGAAAELDTRSWQGVAGIGVTALVFTFSAVTLLDELASQPKLKTITPLARRILGSWVAAIGLLLAALAIQTSGF
jgi:hypothetical protein